MGISGGGRPWGAGLRILDSWNVLLGEGIERENDLFVVRVGNDHVVFDLDTGREIHPRTDRRIHPFDVSVALNFPDGETAVSRYYWAAQSRANA
jgi:hypothetical protein